MQKPKTYKDWANEAFLAYKTAMHLLEKRSLLVNDKYEIFRHAPTLASIDRDINGKTRGIEMFSVIKDIEQDFKVDAEARQHFYFNFIYAYIHSHTYADLLDEFEADRIMDYINNNYELFNVE